MEDASFLENTLRQFNHGIEFGVSATGVFFMMPVPEEIEELEPEDRSRFIAYELSQAAGADMIELEPGVLVCWSIDQTPLIADMRNDVGCFIALGNTLSARKAVESFSSSPGIHPLSFCNDLFHTLVDKLSSLTEISFEFSADALNPHERSSISGVSRGQSCKAEYRLKSKNCPESFCLRSISGSFRPDSASVLTIRSTGNFEIKDYDRQSFNDLYSSLNQLVQNKIGTWLKKHIVSWRMSLDGNYFELFGQPIVYELPSASPYVAKTVQRLLKSESILQCKALTAKSIQLDKLLILVDSTNGEKVEASFNPNVIRIKITSPLGIPLALRLEYFLQRHLNAELSYYAL